MRHETSATVPAPPAPGTAVLVGGLLAAAAIPRVLALPFNENLYGDAISRTELAERWWAAPHFMTAFGDGAAQYGPLHLYLVGLATGLVDREVAGRLVSFVFGVLTIIPLFFLARRLFDLRAAVAACLAFSVWGLHVQFSTTAASEAVALMLLIAAVAAFARGVDTGEFGPLAGAALWLTLSAAVRYDAWLYIALLPLAAVATGRRRDLPVGRVVAFVVMCLPFPVAWMAGNLAMHGDPLYPLTFINDEHRAWAATYAGGWREAWLRLQGVGFWPAMAVVSLTPGVALLGALGIVADWRERRSTRWVATIAAAPLVYYGLRTALAFNFVPLARFMAPSLALMLPFIWRGLLAVRERWGRRISRRVEFGTVALAVAMPLLLVAATFRADGRARDIVRPLSPLTTNPRPVLAAASALRASLERSPGRVAVDDDARYRDLALVFYSRLPDRQVVRLRWPGFEREFDAGAPEFVVRFEGGRLAARADVRLSGRTLTVRGVRYAELDGFTAPVHVYRREFAVNGKMTVCPDRRGTALWVCFSVSAG